MMRALFIFSITILATVPLWFVWHKVYKDGLFGRMALCGISFSSWVILLSEFVDGWIYDPSPEVIWLIASFSVFIVWHLVRFELRCVRERKALRGEIERRTTQNNEGDHRGIPAHDHNSG